MTLENVVSSALEEIFESENSSLATMYGYLINTGGKRTRPVMFLRLVNDIDSELYRNRFNSLLRVACGIELIHQASLVHDDLPALDNDDNRRGMPTIHKKFSEADAILFGDWLQTKGFDAILLSGFNVEISCNLTKLFLTANMRLIEGQILDLSEGSNPVEVGKLKTAELFSAIFEAAGIVTKLEKEACSCLRNLGVAFGQLFQIADDIDDRDKDLTSKKVNNSFLTLGEGKVSNLIKGFVEDIKKNMQVLDSTYKVSLESLHEHLDERLLAKLAEHGFFNLKS
ncbi:MAG: polyprenyl synthetase family protein [Deltaproteobacteria bacterium]|nr:polyprenyl synthetase family protein [Deltaproteobacteria bacterium]